MAISKGQRFPVAFDEAFPQGLLMMGEVVPDTEYQSQQDRARGRVARQRVDELTGRRQWKFSAADPAEPKANRASFEVTVVADVQPVPTTTEIMGNVRPVRLDGLTAEPRVAGNGEFKYLSYVFRAIGFTEAGSGGAKAPRSSGGSGESSTKAA